jgi:hypothetical protein
MAIRTGELVGVCTQAFRRTQDDRWFLVIDRPGVWMLRDTQVRPRPTAVLVPDVTFTDVASQYHDLLGGLENAGLAVPHAELRGR